MNKLLLAIAVVLSAMPLHVGAQEMLADASVGKWVGDWDSRGRPSGDGSGRQGRQSVWPS
jgi:hypothetical protein